MAQSYPTAAAVTDAGEGAAASETQELAAALHATQRQLAVTSDAVQAAKHAVQQLEAAEAARVRQADFARELASQMRVLVCAAAFRAETLRGTARPVADRR